MSRQHLPVLVCYTLATFTLHDVCRVHTFDARTPTPLAVELHSALIVIEFIVVESMYWT